MLVAENLAKRGENRNAYMEGRRKGLGDVPLRSVLYWAPEDRPKRTDLRFPHMLSGSLALPSPCQFPA